MSKVSQLHYRYGLVSFLLVTLGSPLNSYVGWILATGWQGSVVGLSFAAGTIVSDHFLDSFGRIQMIGWCISPADASSILGEGMLTQKQHQIQGLITLNNSSYSPQQWHGTLLVIAMVVFAIVFNTSMAKQLPLVQVVILIVHVIGLIAIIIPLLVMAPSHNTGRVALLDFYNGGGWPTVGLATMIGLLTPLGSMLGFDCAVHMCRPISRINLNGKTAD